MHIHSLTGQAVRVWPARLAYMVVTPLCLELEAVAICFFSYLQLYYVGPVLDTKSLVMQGVTTVIGSSHGSSTRPLL